MQTWVTITIIIVVLASLSAAGGLTWFFIRKRSQRRANDEYTKSLINEALLTENLAKQQKVVSDIQSTIDTSNTRTDEEQQALMTKLAESQKELEQLKNNITLAVKATNSLSHAKNALVNKDVAIAARETTAAELKDVENRNKAANKTTVDALNFTTRELEKQAADLKAFKASLQADAVKLASEVGNPTILPPELPDSSKPSIRTIWDAAVSNVATADDQDLAIKQMSELYRIIGADVDDLKNAAKQMNAVPTVCERITKIQCDNKAYGCPSGWNVFGDQCYRGPCDNSPTPTPKPPTPKPPTPKPPTPKPPTPKPPTPKPPTALERKYPYWGWNEFAGLRCKNNNNSGCTTAYKDGQLVDAEQPPAPTPKPQPPRPPTELEKKYPYWGWNEHSGLRCTNNDNTGCNTGYDAKGQLVDLNPDRPPTPSGNNSHRISDSALRMMGMDAEQLSNILSMIGGPEQSNVEWWKGVDRKDVYGYCENINDDRGVTIGVSGFVTKWGLAQKIVKDAGGGSHDVGQCRPGKPTRCSFCDWVRANGSNQKFIDAQWEAYANEFMKLVPKYVPSQFKDNALIKGMMLDTAMNAGEFKEGNSWGLKEVTQAARGNDAASWAYSFLDARYNHFTAGNSQSMRNGRIGAWKKLVQDNKWEMRINPCKYAFCSGRCLGC